ncbi:hypothetical protein DFW101_2868 [Solidesulfovibrio carbinoliphilus subsp. oakridgensis]|uniref:Uncharacterized protein n=1 Tax=Solidesulfovibrio carbinoliphilus subsp. oakridgensis TaxID=694327 RepID=G7QBK7_9BACT|nr:hypothetical protein DFW101_2868 [Solidesulfovibrio carbinoliphilus subsp. oakridgensis]
MRHEKASARIGQGKKSVVESFRSTLWAAIVKFFVLLAAIGRAGGAR